MAKIYFKKSSNHSINPKAMVKVIRYNDGKKIRIKNIAKKNNNLANYKKINNKEYLDMTTGEIKEYNISKNRKNTLKKSIKKLEDLIRNNFFGKKNELFITLTYEEKTDDIKFVIKHFKNFWQKLKRRYPNLEHIYVIEMQLNRCSWHLHVLLKDTKNKILYIDKKEIEMLWGKGYVWVSRIKEKELKKEIDYECN